MAFIFELNDDVEMVGGAFSGVVFGRVEYADKERCYLVKKIASDGLMAEHWLDESLLTKINSTPVIEAA